MTGVARMKAANQTIRAYYSDDLHKHDNLMKLLETYHKVLLPDNEKYPEKLAWCLEFCQNKFRDIKQGEGMYWYFENEQDATMFAMKWSS
jgi:hypothetical protein